MRAEGEGGFSVTMDTLNSANQNHMLTIRRDIDCGDDEGNMTDFLDMLQDITTDLNNLTSICSTQGDVVQDSLTEFNFIEDAANKTILLTETKAELEKCKSELSNLENSTGSIDEDLKQCQNNLESKTTAYNDLKSRDPVQDKVTGTHLFWVAIASLLIGAGGMYFYQDKKKPTRETQTLKQGPY